MLEEILVENLLIIDSVKVTFHPGLNVISGETGVGKSLLLSAISGLFGDKIESDETVSGTTRIEGLFRIRPEDRALLPDGLLPEDEDEIVIRVNKPRGGAQRCYVNGSIVSRRELKGLAASLVDVHGQRDMQRLLFAREQVGVLDAYAGTTGLAAAFANVFARYGRATDRITRRIEVERQLQDKLDLARFQRSELESADIRPGEQAELATLHRVLTRARETAAALADGCEAIEDVTTGIVGRLSRLGAELQRKAEGDDELAEVAERTFAAAAAAEDLARDMRVLGERRSRLEGDPGEVQARLNLLNDLANKYRLDEPGLLARCAELGEQVARMEKELADLQSLDHHAEELAAELRKLGADLAARRKKAGTRLAREVETELRELKMKHARFRVDAGDTREESVSSLGFGCPRFVVRTNPGQPYADLADAASGGELSRILLALKSVLAETHRMPLMIFDEIETGVGPRLGSMLGRRLRRLSDHRQVLCITHLPQIAAFAQKHLKIDKIVKRGRTRAQVEEVDGKTRLAELAAMLGGGDDRLALKQAKSLVAEAAEVTAGEAD